MPSDRQLSVLIVDDSNFFVSLLAGKLETEYGMATTTATDPTNVLSRISQGSIDCIVSDYQMPETSGIELYGMINKRYDIPFILLTGQGDEKIASRAIRMGIDEYIVKQAVEGEDLGRLATRIEAVVENHRTKRKYEELVDNSPDQIAQLSISGEILSANEAMATEFGTTQSELVGQKMSNILPDDVAANRLQNSNRAVATGGAVTFQDSIGVRHFHNIAVPLSNVGQADSIQLVTREITCQKHNEEKLRQKSEKLAIINRIVRHDINNDIQLLTLWADQLMDHVDETGAELVSKIRETSTHITELTSIARDFVESIEDENDPELTSIYLDPVIEAEVEKAAKTHDEAEFVVDDIPQVSVRANELLSSVFANLLNNAVRHNESADPEVHVDGELRDDTVVVRVADNGSGIPDDQKEELFGKGNMGPESPGTGIGLYLVHTLVEQYNGQVWIKDNEPTGAVFVVEMPATTTDTSPQSAPLSS